MTSNQRENQSLEIEPQVILIMELSNKDLKMCKIKRFENLEVKYLDRDLKSLSLNNESNGTSRT